MIFHVRKDLGVGYVFLELSIIRVLDVDLSLR